MGIRKTAYLGTIVSVAALSMSMAQATNNTLGQLNCASGETATFDGENWVCGDVLIEVQPTIDDLVARLDALEAENQALKDRLSCVTSTSNDTELVFEGCNVHVRNGAGNTNSINGVGNLILGYDAARSTGSDKTGSHNMVIGDGHNYNRFGGFVAGFGNAITGDWASVSGGQGNTANGAAASISGGRGNLADGHSSNVSGGTSNKANGSASSVSGGWSGTAEGDFSSISGGLLNTADGETSSISGGRNNVASGNLSSVSGGRSNTASGDWSSILGGSSQSASTNDDTIPALP